MITTIPCLSGVLSLTPGKKPGGGACPPLEGTRQEAARWPASFSISAIIYLITTSFLVAANVPAFSL